MCGRQAGLPALLNRGSNVVLVLTSPTGPHHEGRGQLGRQRGWSPAASESSRSQGHVEAAQCKEASADRPPTACKVLAGAQSCLTEN